MVAVWNHKWTALALLTAGFSILSRLKGLGWTATTGLREGLAQTYEWYVGAH